MFLPHQSINQSVNQSISQSISQSIKQSSKQCFCPQEQIEEHEEQILEVQREYKEKCRVCLTMDSSTTVNHNHLKLYMNIFNPID